MQSRVSMLSRTRERMMRSIALLAGLFLACILLSATTLSAQAADFSGANESTGYRWMIRDDAEFFDGEDMTELESLLQEITQYCNVGLLTTTDHAYSSTTALAEGTLSSMFGGNANAVVYVIDRDLNEIYLLASGRAGNTLTVSRCYAVTDNTYQSAHNGRYYKNSCETMEQVLTLMQGQRIAQPMKIICSILLAIIVALLINYFIVMAFSRTKKASKAEIIEGTFQQVNFANAAVMPTGTTRTYRPINGHGGGGHGGHGGGGHGGGGHHSGGGHHGGGHHI